MTNPLYDRKLKKILNNLIANEIVARQIFSGCVFAIGKDQKHLISDMFSEIAAVGFTHANELQSWGDANDYQQVFKFKDYERLATARLVEILDSIDTKNDAPYYVKKAVKAISILLQAYSDALNYEHLPVDLNSIFLQHKFCKESQLNNLNTVKSAIANEVQLMNW